MFKTLILAGTALALSTAPALAQTMTTTTTANAPAKTMSHSTATHAKMTVTRSHTVTKGPAYHMRHRVVHHRHVVRHKPHHAMPMNGATHTETMTKTTTQTKM